MGTSAHYEEAEYIIKSLRNGENTTQQTLILLTSVMTWINTPKKYKRNFPKPQYEDSDLEEEQKGKRFVREDESDSEGLDENKKVPENEKILYFTDSDYQQRVPPPRYQQVKNLEMLAMAASKSQNNLRVFTICSGLLYGNGEANDLFYEFFRRAWLSLH